MSRAGRDKATSLGLFCLLTLLLIQGTPRLLSAPDGSALRFDGLDDRVTFGTAPALGVTTFTIETWFRRDGAGATATTGGGGVVAVPLVTKGTSEAEGSNRDTNYFLGIDGKRRVLVADFEDTATGANHPVFGVTAICDGVWYHAAASYDGTTWRLYLNGNLEAEVVVGSYTPRFDSIQHFAIGSALNSSGSAGGAFQGAMDEVRVWSVARSAADIQAAMTDPLPAAPGLIGRWGLDENTGLVTSDSAGSGVTGTLRNGIAWTAGSPFVWTPTPPGDYGMRLKGTTAAADYVSFGAAPGLGAAEFTVETWFKRDAAGVTTSTGSGGLTSAVPLVSKGRNEGEGSTTDVNYFLGIAGGVLAADFEEGVGGVSPGLNHPLAGITTLQNNQWYHGAVTYDGSTMRLYLNGSLEATAVVNRPPRSNSIAHAALGTALNSAGAASGFFAGTLDETRIWNHARTAAQIASGYDREIATASGLLGRWSFNECCARAADSSGQNVHGTLFGTSWTWVTGAPLTGAVNEAPAVAAGSDQAIVLPASALINGAVTDDGHAGAPVSVLWTATSGPGPVAFADPTALATLASFTTAGTYELTLTASDGELTASDAVTVVVAAGAPNLPPVVEAGPDQTSPVSVPVPLTGSVSDDGLPGGDPITSWTKISGPGAVTVAQPNEPVTTATFAAAGTYVMMLTANDGLLTGSDVTTVIVTPPGPDNKALDFGGSNAYVALGPSGLGAAAFTIEAWFRRDGTGATTTTGSGGITAVPLVTKGRSESDGGTMDMNYFLGIRSDGVIAADFEEGSGGASPGLNHPAAGTTIIQNNVWYHAAATYDGTRWRLYLNGELERDLVVSRPPQSNSLQHAAIGSALNSSGAASGFFDGAIDEVRIWSVARTQQQIVEGIAGEIVSAPGLLGRWGLNDGVGTLVADSSGRGMNGTVTGTNWSWGAGAPFDLTPNTPPALPVLVTPGAGATAPTPALLSVAVSDSDGDPLTVTYYGRPKTVTAPNFTLAVLPDTQHYVDNATFAPTFTTQTNWIVANRDALNIAFVSHLGDIAEHQDQVELEWQRADASMSVLDVNGVPYGVSPGNHDQTANGVANYFDQYFPVSRFLGLPWYLGYLGAEVDDPVNRLNKNNYELFSVGGLDFLIIHIEHDWPGYSVTWADKIIKRYPDRRVILSTHLFLNTSNARPTSAQFRTNGTSAEAVWQQIIKPNCNVFMVINGHYPGEGRRTDLNDCGQPVHQVLMDYQSRQNGGDGWLRYFTFKPSENKVYAYTYSPTRNGGAGEFETDDSSQFVLDYGMQGTPFELIATTESVAAGTTTTTTWNNLVPGGEYEWYAAVNDGRVTTTGPVWSFNASANANTPPVAADDAWAVAEDDSLTVPAPGVLGNDTDFDDDEIAAYLVQSPAHGTLVLDPDGRFTYAPAAGFNGVDTFTYVAGDGALQSAAATVTLTVTPVNDAPLAIADAAVTVEDVAVAIAVLANDSDADGDSLAVTSAGTPSNGSTVASPDGTITYTPAENYHGSDSFTYTISDGQGGSATATVSVTVSAANDGPVAVADAAATPEDTPVTIAVLGNDVDIDGQPLGVTGVTTAAHGLAIVNPDGTVTYTPAPNYNGADTFSYTLGDGQGGTASAVVSITVTPVNDAPAAANDIATTAEDTLVTISPLANDSDPDGDILTLASAGTPLHGSAVVHPDGTLTYMPAANYTGADSVTYTITDGQGGSATATIQIAVTGTNDGPRALDDAAVTAEDSNVSIDVLANDSDIDGDAVAVTAVGTPAHGDAVANPDGTVTYTPAANYNGVDAFSYTIGDGNGGNATATVTVGVTSVNDAPGAADDAATTPEDTAVTIAVLANDSDPDGDSLAVTAVGTPLHGSAAIDPGGTITYTPAANYSGTDSVSYTVGDGQGGSATAALSLTIAPVNDAPVAAADAATTAEDTAATVAVLANDSDVDGDALTVATVGTPAHGSAVASPDGTITYTPAAGYVGPDSVTYTADDGHGGSATATLTLTVTPVNDAPVAVDDAATTAEDSSVVVPVLANDSDADGDTLSIVSVGPAAHGSAVANPDGTITYSPALNYAGADSLSYTIGDGHGGTATATLGLTITPINDAPVAADDAATTAEDMAVGIAVLGNDSDADGDGLSVTAAGTPQHGTLAVDAGGTITYTPAAGYHGPDAFTYTIGDDQGGSATASVTITVTPVNDAPVAAADAATTAEDSSVVVAVLANDSDVDGDSLTVSSVGTPAHGSAALNPDGTITYAPDADYAGADSVSYTIGDGQGGSATATVSLTVTPVNDVPIVAADSAATAEDVAVSIAVLANDSDADGDGLSIAAVSTPQHGSLAVNAGGTITYTPAAGYHGGDTFTYTVGDDQGGSATATVTITIASVNDAPVAAADAAATAEDTAVSIAVLTNDSDADDDSLSVSSVTPPAYGSVSINSNGTLTYDPAPNDNGQVSFSYTVSDGHGAFATAAVVVDIASVNDVPQTQADAAATAEDTPVTVQVVANDVDGDDDYLVVSAVSAPAHGVAAIGQWGAVTYTPAADFNGSDSFSYTVVDGNGGSAIGSVTMTVTAAPDAPAAAGDAATTVEDTAVTVSVLANDSDVDGDSLSIASVTQPEHGTAVAQPDGTITYTPALNYSGTDGFSYVADDGSGRTATAAVTIAVTSANDAPVAAADMATTAEDTAVTVGVLANDSDADGDSLSLVAVGAAAHGSAVINPDGTIGYTPAADHSGADSVSYTVSDGNGGLSTATIGLAVTPVNDAPVAAADLATTVEDTSATFAVLANDSDVDGDTLVVSGASAPDHGTAVVNPDGTIGYTPAADYSGADSVAYTVSDGHGGTATATVTITVTPGNDAPAAAADEATTAEDTTVTVSVLANDSDADGDSLSLVAVGAAAHGSAVANPDGTVAYTPAANYSGADAFNYTVSDGNGGTATATVSVTITPVNDAPIAAADAATTPEDIAVTVAVLANDSDPDGDSLAAAVVQGPAHGTVSVNGDGTITYTPAANSHGSDSFTYRARDGSADSGPAVVSLTVTPVNDAPSVSGQSVTAFEGVAKPIVLGGSDVEGDALSYQVVATPTHGVLSGAAPNLVYTPNGAFTGSDSLTFTAADGAATSAPATVEIIVRSAGRAPEVSDQWLLADEDTPTEVVLQGGDPEGDPLAFIIVVPPSHGTLSGTAPNLVYTPDPDYSGEDRFVFRASDGVNDSNDAAVDLWIFAQNDPPVVSDLAFTTTPGGTVTGQLQALDPDGDWIFYWVTADPAAGSVTFDPYTGVFTYVAAPGNPGFDAFTYTVYDMQSQGNDATVQIVVTSP